MAEPTVPPIRVTRCNDRTIRPAGEFVLYWMIAQRRTVWNFGLQHAVARANELGKPLLILEALRTGYDWASDRIHRFVIEGMLDNSRSCADAGVTYYPYVEPSGGAGKGLLEALAQRACLVVTDEFPCFFLPQMVSAAAGRLEVALEQVDGNGILPLRATEKPYPTAYSFRRHLQKTLFNEFPVFPVPQPLSQLGRRTNVSIPAAVSGNWPLLDSGALWGEEAFVALISSLPIDHSVPPVSARGGSAAGEDLARSFVDSRLKRYLERNQPDADAESGLSPYLHFGHVSPHFVVNEIVEAENWSEAKLSATTKGQREGWWGMSQPAEAFLDQIVTWRELGYGFCFHRPDDFDHYESLPDWVRTSLDAQAGDDREYIYDLEEFAGAATHDDLWNAAQRQLVLEGRIHNYLRMLWGKKILEWSESPRAALEVMIELNNRYALDGRDPNSYSGIFWTLGRFDRPWAPERPVFGVIRFMSSANAARKLRLKEYTTRYSGQDDLGI